MSGEARISVGGASPYDVVVGRGLMPRVGSMIAGANRALVVCDPRVRDRADAVCGLLNETGIDATTHVLPLGEKAKSLSALADVWSELGRRQLTRDDALVSVGGGATTDVTGFAAATWLRGVRIVHVPTTLLAMVDAAVGGKTAVNTEAGKNLVGAFHPPAGVLVDLEVLDTLPATEWVNGMAEVVKAGFIADPVILDLVEGGAVAPASAGGREVIERSIRMKAAVVSADLREAGPREMLNYGHTLGHAIEQVEGYTVPHGHAVSVGMVFAAALSVHAGRLDAQTAQRHRSVLSAVGLPTTYRRHTFDELLEVMRVDKKARGSKLRFVVLDKLAGPSILEAPSESWLRAAFDEVAA